MKNGFLSIISILLLTVVLLCSCDPLIQPVDTQHATDTPEITTAADTAKETAEDTAAVTAGTTDAATAAATTEAATEAPPANPYAIFTYNNNKVSVSVTAPYAILIDAKTNEILYMSGDPFARIYPASTTKLLTAMLALKYCEPDLVLTPGDELSLMASDSSRAYIKSHHKLTVEMLIEGMMLPSGGDAAYVIAAGAGRAIAKNDSLNGIEAVSVFIDEMNKYGKELGLTGSHFTCPDGYHDNDHYTTLIDIMIIARKAMDEPIIMKYAGTYEDNVRYASGHKNTWTNTNSLLNPDSKYFYENATGLKTGTTDEAGRCIVASAALGSRSILAGVFGAPTDAVRYNDARTLLVAGMAR